MRSSLQLIKAILDGKMPVVRRQRIGVADVRDTMAGFRDADHDAGAQVELIDVATAGTPRLPPGEDLLDANLYAVIELIAARAPRRPRLGSTFRSTRASRTAFAPSSLARPSSPT